MNHLKLFITEIPRRRFGQPVSVCLLGAAFLTACSVHSATITTGVDIHRPAEDGVRPRRVALLVFETSGTKGPRDLCRWSGRRFHCLPVSQYRWGLSSQWLPQRALSKTLHVSLLSAENLNNDDVEAWYARDGERYARSIDDIIQGVGGEGRGEAIEFLGQAYGADHLLVVQRLSGTWSVDSDFELNVHLYRVETRQEVWSATVTADIGPTDQSPDRCNPDVPCWFWSGRVYPGDEEIWKALFEELAASVPFGQPSQR